MQIMFLNEAEAIQLQTFFHRQGLKEHFSKHKDLFIFSFPETGKSAGRYIDMLTQFIIQIKRGEFLNKILSERFHYENKDEREQIIEIVAAMCNGQREELTALTGKIDEYVTVREAIVSFFHSADAILFDSLLKFRLKEYYKALTKFLHIAIDEYKMEQEYQMFISMLRDYLNNRDSERKLVHLSLGENISFYDENFQQMSKEQVMTTVDRRLLANHPVYIDSAVIAPLLSMAPEKILLYTLSEEKPLVRTLVNIFEERLVILPEIELHK